MPEQIAALVGLATHEVIAQRADDAGEWIELLLEATTEPVAARAPETSPLEARPGDLVGPYLVEKVLGHGASARVLQVSDDSGHSYALKVSLGPEHDVRLDAEAAGTTRAVLQKIEQATPLVEAGWSSLTPQRQKGKALEISPEFARMRLTSIARAEIAGARSLDSIVVLREPAEIVEAFVKEAGLNAAPKGPASKSAGGAGGAAKRGGKAQ